jgi:hypothetical protein
LANKKHDEGLKMFSGKVSAGTQLNWDKNSVSQAIEKQILTEADLTNVSEKVYRHGRAGWLDKAVATNNVKFVQLLLKRFPAIVKDYKKDSSPSAQAFQQYNLAMLEALLSAGADITLPYKNAKNLISYAYDLFLNQGRGFLGLANPYRHCMQTLLERRPTDAEDKAGYNEILKQVLKELGEPTPKVPGLRKLLMRLLQAGANPNAAKECFHYVVSNPRPDVIEMLRRYGADFSSKTKHKTVAGEMSLADYAMQLCLNEKTAGMKQKFLACNETIERLIKSGEELHVKHIKGIKWNISVGSGLFGVNLYSASREVTLNYSTTSWEYLSSANLDEIINNKDCIFAYYLQLPLKKKIAALEQVHLDQAHAFDNLISLIVWEKRGSTSPTATNGLRARIARELISSKLQLQQLENPPLKEAAESDSEESEVQTNSLATEEKPVQEIMPLAPIPIPVPYVDPLTSAAAPSFPSYRSTTGSLYPILNISPSAAPAPLPVAPQPYVAPQNQSLELRPIYNAPTKPAPTTRQDNATPKEMSTTAFNEMIADMPAVKKDEKKVGLYG